MGADRGPGPARSSPEGCLAGISPGGGARPGDGPGDGPGGGGDPRPRPGDLARSRPTQHGDDRSRRPSRPAEAKRTQRTGRRVDGRSGPSPKSAGANADSAYLADFSWVRRQRLQTRALVGTPFCWITIGCRFGCMRRCARTRFIPEDWGLKPPIDSLPQIAQERAMRGPSNGSRWGVRAEWARTER